MASNSVYLVGLAPFFARQEVKTSPPWLVNVMVNHRAFDLAVVAAT